MRVEEFLQQTKKRSKYGNKWTMYNGRKYQSKKEAEYARQLDTLKTARNLKDKVIKVEYQVPFKISIGQTYIATYFADFRVTYADRHQEVVDVKSDGTKTDVYRLKKRLVEALYPFKILEV